MSQYLTEKKKPNYEYTRFLADTISKVYPFVTLETIGYSWAGRNIYALSLGNPNDRVLMTGAAHGSEWVTGLVLYRFLENLCSHYRKKEPFSSIPLDTLFAEKGVCFIPFLNPDGVEICLSGCSGAGAFDALVESAATDYSIWNANARGVDLDRNFDANWNAIPQSDQTNGPGRFYKGPSPHSELESYALSKFCEENQFSAAFALHAPGEEIYYKCDGYDPKKAELMAKVLSASSGYALVRSEGEASFGSFKDWFIQTFNRPAFTIEAGRGQLPLGLDVMEQLYEQLYETLLIGILF